MTSERARYLIKVYDRYDFSQKFVEFEFNSMRATKIVDYFLNLFSETDVNIPELLHFDICQKRDGDILQMFDAAFIEDRYFILREVK